MEAPLKICMIGAGYVGWCRQPVLLSLGGASLCVNKDRNRIAQLNNNVIPIYEPGLDELVARNLATGRIRFSSFLPEGVQGADVVFLAVGTPMRRGDGYADLSYVFEAVGEMAAHLDGSSVIA